MHTGQAGGKHQQPQQQQQQQQQHQQQQYTKQNKQTKPKRQRAARAPVLGADARVVRGLGDERERRVADGLAERAEHGAHHDGLRRRDRGVRVAHLRPRDRAALDHHLGLGAEERRLPSARQKTTVTRRRAWRRSGWATSNLFTFQSTRSASLPGSIEPTACDIPCASAGLTVYLRETPRRDETKTKTRREVRLRRPVAAAAVRVVRVAHHPPPVTFFRRRTEPHGRRGRRRRGRGAAARDGVACFAGVAWRRFDGQGEWSTAPPPHPRLARRGWARSCRSAAARPPPQESLTWRGSA